MPQLPKALLHGAGQLRGNGLGVAMDERPTPLEIGKGRIVKQGADVAVLNFGARLGECLKAADMLAAKNIAITVADARFAKPLDEALVAQLLKDHSLVITIEEGASGGFGAHVLSYAANAGLIHDGAQLRVLTLPDSYQAHDTQDKMYAEAGLDAAHLVAQVEAWLGRAARSDAA